jgi:hypothetical protein
MIAVIDTVDRDSFALADAVHRQAFDVLRSLDGTDVPIQIDGNLFAGNQPFARAVGRAQRLRPLQVGIIHGKSGSLASILVLASNGRKMPEPGERHVTGIGGQYRPSRRLTVRAAFPTWESRVRLL